MEAENQVLRQQTLLQSPVKRMTEHLSIPTTPTKQVLFNTEILYLNSFTCALLFTPSINLCRIWI